MYQSGKKSFILTVSWTFLMSIVLTMNLGLARANAPRVTAGDVRAVLNASITGGFGIRFLSGTLQGAPADFRLDGVATIRPFPPFDGKHYCEEDWHVLNVAFIYSEDRQESESFSETAGVQFYLDGTQIVNLMETPLKFSFGAWAQSFGYFIEPMSLTIGAHTFRLTDAEGFDTQITFYMDAAGTGSCVE